MIGGAIVRLGKSYAITLQATECQTGETLVREQAEAGDKEHVLRAVATATTRMRAKLGESLASIQKLAVPSEQVTTASLEAFQSYALGRRQQDLGLSLDYRRATDLDRNFATAYNLLGVMYCNAGDYASCFEYRKKAFCFIERVETPVKPDLVALRVRCAGLQPRRFLLLRKCLLPLARVEVVRHIFTRVRMHQLLIEQGPSRKNWWRRSSILPALTSLFCSWHMYKKIKRKRRNKSGGCEATRRSTLAFRPRDGMRLHSTGAVPHSD